MLIVLKASTKQDQSLKNRVKKDNLVESIQSLKFLNVNKTLPTSIGLRQAMQHDKHVYFNRFLKKPFEFLKRSLAYLSTLYRYV